MQKEGEQCHSFFKSILQVISLSTDAGFGRCRETEKSWDLGKSNQRTVWACKRKPCFPCKYMSVCPLLWLCFWEFEEFLDKNFRKYCKKTWVSCCCQNCMSLIHFHQSFPGKAIWSRKVQQCVTTCFFHLDLFFGWRIFLMHWNKKPKIKKPTNSEKKQMVVGDSKRQ